MSFYVGRWAGASDIKLTPTAPISLSISGEWRWATRRLPSAAETASIVDLASRRPEASARALGGQPENFSHEIALVAGDRRSGRVRFRANASACQHGAGVGLALTLRTIPGSIPQLSDLGVADDLAAKLFPANGLVTISGVMGHGKTTTIAAVMPHIRTHSRRAVMAKSATSPAVQDGEE